MSNIQRKMLFLQIHLVLRLSGGKGAHYLPSVFLHWEINMLFFLCNRSVKNDTYQFHLLIMQKILIMVTAPDTMQNIVLIRTPATEDFISYT